jgi:hypothetical protein
MLRGRKRGTSARELRYQRPAIWRNVEGTELYHETIESFEKFGRAKQPRFMSKENTLESHTWAYRRALRIN